jgi:peptidoglycan/LPS O-acetylase OafA/YrhL
VRGAAVAAVLLFHGGFTWAKGGYLGVSTFFTLSGFLITGLLLTEWDRNGRIVLHRFWERRFRRLAPALLAALLVVALYAAFVADPDQLHGIRGDAFATLGYVANWRFILSGQSYAHLFDAPSPILHAWSLAIEEQFYVVFPLLVAGVLTAARGRRSVLTGVLGALTLGSVATSIALRSDVSRVYYGTDTRAAELLLGALLAVWVAGRGSDLADRRRPVVATLGVFAGLASLVAGGTVDQSATWLYRGGFALYGLGTAALVAAAVAPGPVRALTSTAPLRLLGKVSYGVYLYHWPIFLWLTPERTDLSGVGLFALRLAVTFAVASVSYLAVEQPIRRGGLPGWRGPVLLPPAILVVGAVVALTTVPPPPPARLVAVTHATTTTTAPPSAPPIPVVRDATPADPLRILLVGDSVAFDAAPGIEAALEATGEAEVTNGNVAGFGLFQPYDWRTEWPRQLRETQADLVVAMWGGWDDPWYREHGRAAYDEVLDQALAVLQSTGARVLLVGEPVSTDREGVVEPRDTMDAFRAVPLRNPTTWFTPSDDWIAPGGTFTSYLPGPSGPERVRKVDNTHICPAGSARFGEGLLGFLTPRYQLASPDPAWRSGSWALEPRFNDPPGACPA